MALTLQGRIALHIVVFVTALLTTFSFAVWLVVSEVEDAVLDRYLLRTLPAIQHHPTTTPWLEELMSSAELRERLKLDEVPEQPGWFTVFASEDGRQVRWVRGWRDRAYVWSHGLEVEYRVSVYMRGDRQVWTLVNLDKFEYMESEGPQLQMLVLVFGASAWALAVLLSARLARSAMAPVVDLTKRLRAQRSFTEPLAASCSDDEVGVLATALDDALAREREIIEGERRFISDCSHELRTPLSIFQGTLMLLAAEDVDDARRAELLARLNRSAGRLEGLSHTFLVMAREGRIRGSRSTEFVEDIVREAIAEQRLLFPHRTLEVRLCISEDATVDARRDVLFVLLRNLLCNVFQHSVADSLYISWGEAPSPHLQFVEGLTSEPLETTPAAGFGIGLPLVRRLVDAQGWRFFEGRSEDGALLHTIWFDT
jgi:signal transduction histidine kinase